MAAKTKERPTRKPKSTGGCEAHWSKREGRWVWTFRQWFTHPATKESKITRVTAPYEYKDRKGLKAALALKADFAKAKHAEGDPGKKAQGKPTTRPAKGNAPPP